MTTFEVKTKMELDLSRVEYLQAGLTSGRTLRLLPGPGLVFRNEMYQIAA